MKTYRIEQAATAVVLWEGKAASKDAALDAYAHDAGYPSFAEIPTEIGGGDTLDVAEVK